MCLTTGSRLTTAPPGSARGMYLVVSDIEAARTELLERGVEVGKILHRTAPGLLPLAVHVSH